MRTIETTGVVADDHTLTVKLPADTPAGPCRVAVTVYERLTPANVLDGLILFDGVLTDPTDTFRRETLYGDHGL